MMQSTPRFRSAFLRFLFLLFSGSAVLASQSFFKERFEGQLDPGWKWLRENPAAWCVRDKSLQIRIEPGNMWGPANNGKNVLLRDLPDPVNREIEIRAIVANAPTEQYEQVDLVWYYNDSHMVKIGHEMVDGKVCIVMGREEKDTIRTLAIIPTDLPEVELRLVSSKGRIYGEFRKPGADSWSRAGECDLPGQGAPKMSIQCYNGPNNAEHWARISHLEVLTRDLK